MKDQLLCEPTIEALVLDEPIDGWLFIVPGDMATDYKSEPKQELSRWQQLREIGASKLEGVAKVVRGR